MKKAVVLFIVVLFTQLQSAELKKKINDFFVRQFNLSLKSDLQAALFWSELVTSPLNQYLQRQNFMFASEESKIFDAKIAQASQLENNLQTVQEILNLLEFNLKKNNFPLISSSLKISEFKKRLELFQTTIPEDGVVLKYFFEGDKLFVFKINKKAINIIELKNSFRQIEELIQRLCRSFEDYNSGNTDFFHIYFDLEAAYHLYEFLIKKIIETEKPGRIIIIPHKILFAFPFELLVTGFNSSKAIDENVIFSEYRSATFLIEKAALGYAFSLFEIFRRFPRSEYNHNMTLISVDQSSLKQPALSKLKKAKAEAQEIEKIFRNGNLVTLSGTEATKKNFQSALQSSRFVHLITHLYSDKKENSVRLLFAKTGFSSEGELISFSDLKFSSGRSEMLFLSCCQSLQNYFLVNDYFHELLFFFRNNILRSTALSFWAVNEFHGELIYEFYQNIQQSSDLLVSLQQAKKTMITANLNYRQLKYSYAHPFLWANLCLYFLYNPFSY